MGADTKTVDVLAVLDVAATAIENSGGNVAYLRQARAAIAELIEADKEDDAASLELENNPEPADPQTPEQWAAYSRHLDAKDRKRATTKRRADALRAVGGAE